MDRAPSFRLLSLRSRAELKNIAQSFQRHRAKLRIPILVFAILVFFGGIAYSVQALSLKLSDLSWPPLLGLALVIVPITIAYSAINMILMGKAVGSAIGFVEGVRISVFAQVAELLPIPGGAIVRTAGLVRKGAGTLQSTGIVLAFALLWISCAAIGGGLALIDYGFAGLGLIGIGVVGTISITGWLAVKFGAFIAISALALRFFGIALVCARTLLAFAAIQIALEWTDALGFGFGVILGSAASIMPAGLGIGEGISALLAVPLEIAPAAAFLATGLARLVGFIGNMLCALLYLARGSRNGIETNAA